MLDRRLVEDVAARLATDEGLVEKDWHVVRALGILTRLDHGPAKPAFSGGTSLSKGWGIIKRFSEDIDFKVVLRPAASRAKSKTERSEYREHVLQALISEGFTLAEEPLKRNEHRFFAAALDYQSLFAAGAGLRPHIRIEMSFMETALPPIARPIRSLIAAIQGSEPEVAAFPCIDPIETAADKLSALAWRVHARNRDDADDDPTVVRHLHDLAALRQVIDEAPNFPKLLFDAMSADVGRGGKGNTLKPGELLSAMVDMLKADRLWRTEYDDFVRQVSFAAKDERLSFDEALQLVEGLVGQLPKMEGRR